MLHNFTPSGRNAREIAWDVEGAVRRGDLMPGDRLPSVRALARTLGISPTTVASAYRELSRRGVVEGGGRAGTRIRVAPPVRTRVLNTVPEGVKSLLSGGPDPDLLPQLPVIGTRPLRYYGESPVCPALEQVARQALSEDGGIEDCHLAVVGGALDGVERVLGAWLGPGARLALEDPGYNAVLDLVAAMGYETIPVPVDDEGMDPDGLERAVVRGAEAVVITPRAQNPTGAALSRQRADDLRKVLIAHPDVLVIEDDHAGPVAGVEAILVSAGVPKFPRWAIIRSVSKWLGPDMRLAVLVGDEATVGRVEGRQALGAGWVSWILQQVVAHMWSDPATALELKRATQIYAGRRESLIGCLADQGIKATGRSGLTTWVPVDDESGVVSALVAKGWAVAPGERFRMRSGPGIRIAFSTLDPDEAPAFAADLACLLSSHPRRMD